MSNKTLIEYADSTVNPAPGCDGCELWCNERRVCYAGIMTERYAGRAGWPVRFEEVLLKPGQMEKVWKWKDLRGVERVEKPWLNGYPRLVFVNDMGDLFSKQVPFEFIRDEVLLPAMRSPHVLILVTKRARRLLSFDVWLQEQGIAWPENVWVLASVTDAETCKRVAPLLECRAAVKGVSAEPLRGDVSAALREYAPHLQWIIGGTMSGLPSEPGCSVWAQELRDVSVISGAAFFWKQWGMWLPRDQCNEALREHALAMGLKLRRNAEGMECVLFPEGVPTRELDGREWNGMPVWAGMGSIHHEGTKGEKAGGDGGDGELFTEGNEGKEGKEEKEEGGNEG